MAFKSKKIWESLTGFFHTTVCYFCMLLLLSFSLQGQDTDGDLVLDADECELLIPSQSFEVATPYTTVPQGWIANGPWGTHDFPSSPANYTAIPNGNQFLYTNSIAISSTVPVTTTLTLNAQNAVYSESGYIFTFWAGEGASFFTYRNDGTTLVEMGYGEDAASFTPIPDPNASLTVLPDDTVQPVPATANGTWTQFRIEFTVDSASPALGEGILIQISHTSGIDIFPGPNFVNGYQGNYDDFHLLLDTDSDGIENCADPDADGDGIPDGLEAGWATLDATVDGSAYDFDNDGVVNGNAYLTFPGSDSPALLRDQDSDNDGISDADEGCNLGQGNGYDFESTVIADNPLTLIANEMYTDGVIDFWDVQTTGSGGNAIGVHYANVQNTVEDLLTLETYAPNYLTDGTGIYNGPNPEDNGKFAYINGIGTITQQADPARNPVIGEGNYILTVAIGDGIDYEALFRNDGQTTLELGYDNAGTFAPLATRVIEGHETPNGLWKDFSLTANIPTGSPAIGNLLLVRISHMGNTSLNQGAGNYDNIRIDFDFDGDGAPDCLDLDSDDDGCYDATEAGVGYSDDDNDGFLGTGVPTVDVNGLVTSAGGYTGTVDPAVRSVGSVGLNNTLVNENICLGAQAQFSINATASSGSTLFYEWTVSTDGGATYGSPLAETGNTLTITPVAADNNNIYRVEVWSDDFLCRQESTATLTIIPLPVLTGLTATAATICAGDDATFTLSGTPDDIVTFTTDGNLTTDFRVLDAATGMATVTITAPTADTTLDVISIEDGTTGCISNYTAPFSFTETVVVNTVPTFVVDDTNCAPNLLSYSVDFTSNVGTVTTTPTFPISGNTITGVPTGTDILVTVDNNGCIRTFNISAPDCSCPTILAPINGVNGAVCEGQTNPPLQVELPATGLGDDVDWYNTPTGGSPLGSGTSYTPTDTAAGTYTYYAEARQVVSGCTSVMRLAVDLEITPLPVAYINPTPSVEACGSYELPPLPAGNTYYTATSGPLGTGSELNAGDVLTISQDVYIFTAASANPSCFDESVFRVEVYETPLLTFQQSDCALDLVTYSVDFSLNTGIVSPSAGNLNGNRITDIPAGTDVTLTVVNGPCTETFVFTAPDCSCPIVEAPINPVDGQTCLGEVNPALTVALPAFGLGDDVNWFDSATDGNLLAIGTSFVPTETAAGTYTYYAEALQMVSGCTSATRIPVTLTIIEATLPTRISVEVTMANSGNAANMVTVITENTTGNSSELEYSLDDPNGTYQLSNIFTDVIGGLHTVYIRSTNGCGTTIGSEEFLIIRAAKFFTPNGDGFNDTWAIQGLSDATDISGAYVEIYDRYGKLLRQLDPNGSGWDGIFNGRTMPESDYWYKAGYIDDGTGQTIQFNGHFTLKR